MPSEGANVPSAAQTPELEGSVSTAGNRRATTWHEGDAGDPLVVSAEPGEFVFGVELKTSNGPATIAGDKTAAVGAVCQARYLSQGGERVNLLARRNLELKD